MEKIPQYEREMSLRQAERCLELGQIALYDLNQKHAFAETVDLIGTALDLAMIANGQFAS